MLHRSIAHPLPLTLAATLAVAVPMSLAYNQPPSPTVLNQAAAWIGWGFVLGVFALKPGVGKLRAAAGSWALLTALLLVLGATFASVLQHGLPAGLAISIIATVAAAGTLAWVFGTADAAATEMAMRALAASLLVAGVVGATIGVVQVFAPGQADGTWLARTPFPGRAAGNLRQPNHLASLLMWSAVAAVWWLEVAGPRGRAAAVAAFSAVTFGIVLTTSRTGAVGMALLGVWALIDRRLSSRSRTLLIAAPFAYVACWWLLSTLTWTEATPQFGGGERLHAADISSSRFKIWANTLELLDEHATWGVGVGEFNRAWTLGQFSTPRPVAFFDHAHNFMLHLVVEIGLPLGLLVVALLAAAFVSAARAPGLAQRCAFMMVALTLLHSQFEYPLWYAHFLFPTAVMFGISLGGRGAGAGRRRIWAAVSGGAALAGAGLFIVADYQRVVAIYDPPPGAASLDARIRVGQASVLFAHHADYARVTTSDEPHPGDFGRATHYLLDARLMIAWARALAASGEVDRARWVAARLREFRSDQVRDFFAECDSRTDTASFQCSAPEGHYGYEDFR